MFDFPNKSGLSAVVMSMIIKIIKFPLQKAPLKISISAWLDEVGQQHRQCKLIQYQYIGRIAVKSVVSGLLALVSVKGSGNIHVLIKKI